MLRPYTHGDPPQLDDVGADLDVELLEQQLAHGPAGDAGDGLAGAGALQDVARVLAVVLEDAREVGVPRAGPRDLPPARLRGGLGLRGHHVLPVLPVAVDRKSTRLNSSHLVISYAVFCLKKKKKKTLVC